jgi:hypothetical protein
VPSALFTFLTSSLSDSGGVPVGLVLLLASLIAVVIPDDFVEEPSELCVVVGGHGVAAKARVLVVNSCPDTPVEGLKVFIAESLALLGLEVGDHVLAAPISRLQGGRKGGG